MRLLLHDNQICERGTTTSMLDYARLLRSLGHEVEISYWQNSPANVPAVINLLKREFPLHGHSERDRLPSSLRGFDAAYFIKAGHRDGLLAPETHNLVHAVFKDYDPHGSRYAYISRWLADEVRKEVMGRSGRRAGCWERGEIALAEGCVNALEFQHLDLIVDIPSPQDGIRQQLGIADDSFLMLRFGGYDSFDITWAKDSVVQLLGQNSNWHFVGLNTKPFTNHPRAHFLPLVSDPVEKASIIAAADVFVTARGEGEAFGVAIAEALQIGVPVLAWSGGDYRNQVAMLHDLDGLFNRPRDLKKKIRRLSRGVQSVTKEARQARGNQYRPASIAPILENLLLPGE